MIAETIAVTAEIIATAIAILFSIYILSNHSHARPSESRSNRWMSPLPIDWQ
jgi:hypothetical protein